MNAQPAGSNWSTASPQKTGSRHPTRCVRYGGLPIRPSIDSTPPSASSAQTVVARRSLWSSSTTTSLFRSFVCLNPDAPVWHPTTYTKNRNRLLNEELMAKFLELMLAAPEVKPLQSSDHFSVDGTLLRAWASHSSLERIDGLDDGPPPPIGGNGFGDAPTTGMKRDKSDFHGLLISNQAHPSTSDAEARLFKKAPGVGAFLSCIGHCVMENRSGLVVTSEVSRAIGKTERDTALQMARSLRGAHQKTLRADKGYDTDEFVTDLRISGITPHVAQNIQTRRSSVINGRAARHQG